MANQPQKRPTGKPGSQASKPQATKPAAAGTKPAAAAAKPATTRPVVGAARVGGGVVRRRRDPGRTLREENKSIPKGDYTITSKNIQGEVALVKPAWKEGHLIFRPLPALNPEAANDGRLELDPYRYNTDQYQFTDWTRKYPGVDYIGLEGQTPATFNLWDPALTEDQYDPSTNPYVLLWKAVDDAVYKSKTHMHWLDLIDNKASGGRPPLKPVCNFFYFQGLIYRRGTTNFFGAGKLPRGVGPKDYSQMVRLKNAAGRDLYEALNELNPDWDGDPLDFENSMTYGDPVSPQHGRFITVYNAKAGENTAQLQSQLAGLEGSLDVGDAVDGRDGGNDDEKRGYTVEIHEMLTINGVSSKLNAHLSERVMALVMPKLVWMQDVIYVPSNEEQCGYIARCFPRKDVLQYAWNDYPEYLGLDEVQKVLKSSKSVPVNRSNPTQEESLDADTSALLDEFSGVDFDFDGTEEAAGEDVVVDDVDTGDEYADEYDQSAEADAAEGEEAEYEEVAEEGEEAEYEEVAEEGEEAEYEAEGEEAEGDDGEYDYEDPDDAVTQEAEEVLEEEAIDEDADAQEALAGLDKARQRSAGRPAASPPKATTPPKTTPPKATPPKATTPPKPGKPGQKKGK